MVEIKRFCYISSPLQAVQEKVVNTSNAKSINSAYSIIKHLAVAGMEKAKAMGCIAVSGVLTIDAAMDIYNPVWNTEKEADAKNIKRQHSLCRVLPFNLKQTVHDTIPLYCFFPVHLCHDARTKRQG